MKPRFLLAALPILALPVATKFFAAQANESASGEPVPSGRRPPIIVPPIWPPRPIPPVPARVALGLKSQNASVEIRGGAARVTLKQTLHNAQNRVVEGEFLWAVPSGAAISEFSMSANGKKLSAEILEREKAREIYDGIVRKWRDPAILEFIERDLLRAQLFPIPANGEVEIELVYSQTLRGNRFLLPLKPLGISDERAVKSGVEIRLRDADLRGILSPSHPIETRRGKDSTLVSTEWNGPSRDFSLLWSRSQNAVGASLQTWRDPKNPDDDPYFLLLAAPDDAAQSAPIAAKDVVFVFDTSGSMDGEKIEQARRALKTLLSNLRAGDRFGIVTFSSSARRFRETLVAATPQNIAAARDFADDLKALGATNIEEALENAFDLTRNSTVSARQIVFLTDGQPTVGKTEIQGLLDGAKKQNNGARLWTFGLGFDVNTRLLDTLASESGGDADYVLPKEDIEQKVGELYGKIAFPLLQNVSVSWGGARVYDAFPRQIPDLFKGGQIVVLGRMKGGVSREISLEGTVGGAKKRFDGTVSEDGSREIAKLWAARKIGWLFDDARRAGKPIEGEIKAEILALSQKYGVVSPLTAALITEDEPVSVERSRQNLRGGQFGGAPSGAAPQFDFSARAQSGERAVMASKAAKALRQNAPAPSTDAPIKIVGGKTFVLRGGVWTDTQFAAEKSPKIRDIPAFSDEYFALARNSEVAAWLSLGEKIVFVWKGEVYRVGPEVPRG